MRDIPLSKTLDPVDLTTALAAEFARVMVTGTAGQHDHRRWEYSLALRAIALHRASRSLAVPYTVLDVGGAGSSFADICRTLPGQVLCTVVDPKVNAGIEESRQPHAVDAVISISTIEHVPKPLPFLKAIAHALAPGGLLFLTMDCWNRGEEPDTAHFHWMRARIYNKASWCALMQTCENGLGFQRFGGVDWAYHGDHLYGNYSFCSLCLTKDQES